MNSKTNTKSIILKIKRTKVPAPPPAGEKNSGLNPALLFIEPAKDPDADKERKEHAEKTPQILRRTTRLPEDVRPEALKVIDDWLHRENENLVRVPPRG